MFLSLNTIFSLHTANWPIHGCDTYTVKLRRGGAQLSFLNEHYSHTSHMFKLKAIHFNFIMCLLVCLG